MLGILKKKKFLIESTKHCHLGIYYYNQHVCSNYSFLIKLILL